MHYLKQVINISGAIKEKSIKLTSAKYTYMYMFGHTGQIGNYRQEREKEKEIRAIKDSINRSNSVTPVIPHTAKIQRAIDLLKSKYSDGSEMFVDDREVSEVSRLPLDEVLAVKARLAKEEEDRRRFQATGQIKGSGGYHAILPK